MPPAEQRPYAPSWRTHDERSPHDDLRRLLEHAVDDVEPREALDSIRARTRVVPLTSRRNRLLGAGAAVVATAATVLAVAVLGGQGGTTDEPGFAGPSTESVPTQTAQTPTLSPGPSAGAESGTSAVPVYYVGDTSRGPRLYREFHRLDTGGDPLGTALEEAVSSAPDDPDYRTGWPQGTTVDASFDGAGAEGVVDIVLRNDEVDLRTRPDGMSEEEARMAVEQLIYTAQAVVQARSPVQLFVERAGTPQDRTDAVLGVAASEPLTQVDAADALAQVWIIDPAEGAEVTSPFEVSGLAAAFEATVVWELRSGDTVVADGYTTAEQCCTMEPYSFEVEAPPGEYTLVVQDTDPSGGEGFGVWEDTKQVTVLP